MTAIFRGFYVSGAQAMMAFAPLRNFIKLIASPTALNPMKQRAPNPQPALSEWHLSQGKVPTYLRGAQRKKIIRALGYSSLVVGYNNYTCATEIITGTNRKPKQTPDPRDWEHPPQEGGSPSQHIESHAH